MYRNRVKSDQGDHWLRVPLWTTGRGLHVIEDVEICDESDWRARHPVRLNGDDRSPRRRKIGNDGRRSDRFQRYQQLVMRET